MQENALVITLVLSSLLSLAFFVVIKNASKPADFVKVSQAGYKVRNRLFNTLLVAGVLIAGFTLPRAFLPTLAWDSSSNVQTVRADGYQWYWELDRDEVLVDVPVEFLVSSEDVTHGFGVYDEDLRLLGQIQAMPGYVNRLNITFTEPGTYQILCLEYCGLAHHDMVAEIYVVNKEQPTNSNQGEGQ